MSSEPRTRAEYLAMLLSNRLDTLDTSACVTFAGFQETLENDRHAYLGLAKALLHLKQGGAEITALLHLAEARYHGPKEKLDDYRAAITSAIRLYEELRADDSFVDDFQREDIIAEILEKVGSGAFRAMHPEKAELDLTDGRKAVLRSVIDGRVAVTIGDGKPPGDWFLIAPPLSTGIVASISGSHYNLYLKPPPPAEHRPMPNMRFLRRILCAVGLHQWGPWAPLTPPGQPEQIEAGDWSRKCRGCDLKDCRFGSLVGRHGYDPNKSR